MNLQIRKSQETPYHPIFLKILEDIPGGVTFCVADLKTGTEEIKAGALLGEDGSTAGLFHLVKVAELHADAANDATEYQVKKGHQFKVGDIIATKDVASCKAYAISEIDTSNEDYDVLTVGTSLGVAMTAADGVYLIQAAAQDTSGGAFSVKYPAEAILNANLDISGDNPNVIAAAVVRGTVKESLLPYPVSDAQKTALTDRIRFA
jgi:hypothetical protein